MKKTFLSLTLLSFIGVTSFAQSTIAGGDMENWTSVPSSQNLDLEAPAGWFATDNLIAELAPMAGIIGINIEAKKHLFKSEDSHSGEFSAEIFTKNLGDDIGNAPGVLTNGKIDIDISKIMNSTEDLDFSNILDLVIFSGGEPVSQQVDSVHAFVKSGDSNSEGSLMIAYGVKTIQSSSNADSTIIIGQGSVSIPSTASFTEVKLGMEYLEGETPESLIVLFISSDIDEPTLSDGNSLKVDDVTYSFSSTGIHQPLLSEHKLLVYPNPTESIIHFNLGSTEKANEFMLTIFDIQGRVISQERLNNQINIKNTSTWSAGSYYYLLANDKVNYSEKGQFTVK